MRVEARGTEAGRRVDAWVAGAAGVSRSRAVELLAAGAFRVNGAAVKPSRRVKPGDILEGEPPAEREADLVPSAGTVPIVRQDGHLLVVDKPAGLPVHPGAGRPADTLVNVLRGMGVPLAPAGGRLRPGVVHRLDKGTSGLLVLAKTDAAYWKLAKMVERRQLEREYLALVAGVPRPRAGTVDAPLGRDPRHRERFAVVEGGRRAVTHYEVAEAFARAALLRVTLETGRTHQIRVHLAALGHPVLGDRTYGGAAARTAPIGRQALHAARLAFVHPMTGRRVDCASPPPPDMAALFSDLTRRAR